MISDVLKVLQIRLNEEVRDVYRHKLCIFIDRTLLRRILAVLIDAVSVDISLKYSSQSPPAVILTQFGSFFSGRMSTSVLAYVTFLLLII